jgi:DNA-directed RNA polymerase subunit RPC12/RpoP
MQDRARGFAMAKVHVACPTCGGQMLVFRSGETFWYECPNGHRVDITKDIVVDTSSQSLAKCPTCGASYRVPQDKGALIVSCTQCGSRFRYNPAGAPRPVADPTRQPTRLQNAAPPTQKMKRAAAQPQQRPANNPYDGGAAWRAILDDATAKAKAAMGRIMDDGGKADPVGSVQEAHALGRRLVIERLDEAGAAATVYVDGREAGSLDGARTVIIDIDTSSHTVGLTPTSSHIVVPAGDADYSGYYADGQLLLGPAKDEFRDALIGLVVKIFKGGHVRELMEDPLNIEHTFEATVMREGILLCWAAPASESELIPYEAAHLVPDAALTNQNSYWQYLNFLVHEAVAQDPALEYGKGGFHLA